MHQARNVTFQFRTLLPKQSDDVWHPAAATDLLGQIVLVSGAAALVVDAHVHADGEMCIAVDVPALVWEEPGEL